MTHFWFVVVKIGIVGTRSRDHWEDEIKVYQAYLKLVDSMPFNVDITIVSGGCSKGADRFAEEIAHANGIHMERYLPDWPGRGKKAGVERNHKIANSCDYLIACVAPDRKGGTEYTIKFFQQTPNRENLIIV